jgi:hypothetical protein
MPSWGVDDKDLSVATREPVSRRPFCRDLVVGDLRLLAVLMIRERVFPQV